MIKRKLIISILIIIFIISILLPNDNIFASTKPTVRIDKTTGELEFVTTDTKASTSITWETIGFNICRQETFGNPIKDTDGNSKTKDYATIWLKDGEKQEDVISDSKVRVTFTLSEDVINKALEGTGLETIQDNDTIYLNGIFRVLHNGKAQPGYYRTLSSITNAEAWRNPDDFEDRFDIPVKYYSSNELYPVEIHYMEFASGIRTLINKNDLGKKKGQTIVKTNASNIPMTKMVNGKKEYLYRVQYVNLSNPTKVLGARRTLINPYYYDEEYKQQLDYVRNREFIVKKGGLKIIALYKTFPKSLDELNTSVMQREYEEIDPTAVIGADERRNEAFDVNEGIPTSEDLFTNVFTSNYLSTYCFTRKYGTKTYPVNVTKTYHLKWTEKDPITMKTTTKTDTRNVTKTYLIKREYSYWEISSLAVYGLEKAHVINGALPDGSIALTPNGYTAPTVSYKHSPNERDHITEPIVKNITMPSRTIDGGSIEPSISEEDWLTNAEESVKEIKCKNDNLIFNGQTLMSDTEKEKETEKPKEIPDGIEEIGENVLFKSNLTIPPTLANGEYQTTANITYRQIVNINAEKPTTQYNIEDINSVIVHTPTVCDAMIQDKDSDNQMITPDQTRASLILDTNFNISLPTTGPHRYRKGYEYRDYAKYIESRMIKFPFDVYQNENYIKANTWIQLYSDTTQFYLPTWVNEGKYTIDCKSISINATANNALGNTESLANYDLNHYVATDTIDVEVSGRIYGLILYDISDYPIWQTVFRIPNSLSLTGFRYTLGDKDQNGITTNQNKKYTLPLVNGSHPYYTTIGAIKTGYVTRFSLKTVGNMYGENDYIRIKPTFYYVDKQGNNRQEVDLYYSETIQNKKEIMVRMGSELDLTNKKSIRTGDSYLGIPENDLKQTAYYKGVSLREWMAQKRNVYTFTNIMIPESLRTFVGFINEVSNGVTKQKIAQSVQNWYGEYYLPSEIHVVPKGYDIKNYVKYNGAINYKEDIWLNNGYVIVNFDIETIQNGKRHLSYINAKNAKSGYCNMWNREGFIYNKVDNKGNVFHLIDGDYALYDTDKSAADDYISAGTH